LYHKSMGGEIVPRSPHFLNLIVHVLDCPGHTIYINKEVAIMKISAFVLGGIAGAATVMLLRKQSMASMAGGMSQMMKSWSGSKRDSQGKALSLLFGGKSGDWAGTTASTSGHSGDKTHASGESGIEQIAHIASKDDSVKKEINEILEENEEPQI